MKGTEQPYPKPGRVGGKLIREVVAILRDPLAGLQLPLNIDSHILIANSGGLDSTALAILIAKYGRRVGGRITLVHVNHGWRGAESDADVAFVRDLAQKLGVEFRSFRLKPLAPQGDSKGKSWEELAREERKKIYARLTRGKNRFLFTAHHADDLAETFLWRLFTGAASTHGGGIAVRQGTEIRPLLRVRKRDLEAFLKEEGQSWREDRTNHEGRFLRSKMRLELMPALERLFPRAVDHLVKLALEAQRSAAQGQAPELDWAGIFGAAGIRFKRAHLEALRKSGKELHLPGDWKLIRGGTKPRKRLKINKKSGSRAGS